MGSTSTNYRVPSTYPVYRIYEFQQTVHRRRRGFFISRVLWASTNPPPPLKKSQQNVEGFQVNIVCTDAQVTWPYIEQHYSLGFKFQSHHCPLQFLPFSFALITVLA